MCVCVCVGVGGGSVCLDVCIYIYICILENVNGRQMFVNRHYHKQKISGQKQLGGVDKSQLNDLKVSQAN